MDKRPEIDLPEPRRLALSAEERGRRERELLITLTTLAGGYSLVHKLAVPLVLKATALSTSPYSRVDWWWAHTVALLACLYLLPQTTSLLSVLAGAGIVYAAVETIEAYLGLLPGWLAVSRLLSSIPIAGLCIAILTSGRFPIRPRYVWAGTLVAALVLYVSVRVLK